jgi:hypothetical protein
MAECAVRAAASPAIAERANREVYRCAAGVSHRVAPTVVYRAPVRTPLPGVIESARFDRLKARRIAADFAWQQTRTRREPSQRVDELVQFVCALVDCVPYARVANTPFKLTDRLNYLPGFLQRLYVIRVVWTPSPRSFDECEAEIQVGVEEID